MISYVGNGPYCYANSAAMLLESAGESVEPRLIEVLSGVGLGAIWVADSQTLFLSGLASAPDVGLTRSLRLLGFAVVEEAEPDGDAIPIDALELQLGNGPVLLGPLDMGELPYRPNASGANGADHFVLALHVEDGAVVVHDPAGYPAMPLGVEALDRAWRADLIEYRRGTYRRWHSPIRVERLGPKQTAATAIESFSRAYRESRAMCEPGTVVGPEAIETLVAAIKSRQLRDPGLEHLRRFALPLGVRRALDYSWYLGDINPKLADLKSRQAWHLARAHAAACQSSWEPLADHLLHLADLEHGVETALVAAAA